MHRPLRAPDGRAPAPLALALALVLSLVAACGTSETPTPAPPSPTTSPPPSAAASPTPAESPEDDVYAEIQRQVEELRGLTAREPVERQIVDREELARVLRRILAEETPPEELAAYERMYKALGLVAPDASLEALLLDLLTTQVAGLYDPSEDALYVLSEAGELGPVEKVYFAHEYDHALQDQTFDLEAFTDGLDDQSDEALARQALVEGDAYVLMAQWMFQHLAPEELQVVLQEGQDPEALRALERIPPIVRVGILFPAEQGLQWVLGLQGAGGWEAVNEAFTDPPRSTEQVLHPEKYEAGEAPVRLDLPADLAARLGGGWTVLVEDTFGEAQMRTWLEDAGSLATEEAIDAAAGWGGDRQVFLAGPGDAWAFAMRTAWDGTADAVEFERAAERALAASTGEARVLPGAGGRERWVIAASDAPALERLAGALGLAG
ncbi:MAG TPA: hypothetical protein VNJ28_02255 [Candidatus Limnocylindrales bacterium]|nr:hypothetical protein [Candidatus Limnocylindrales bacterium]